MKRLLLLALTTLFLSGCVSKHPLVGRWKTVDAKGHESLLYFKDDQTLDALSQGETLIGRWSLNEEVQPNQLVLTFEEQEPLVTISKLEGDQLLIEAPDDEAKLPTQFSDKAQKYRRQ